MKFILSVSLPIFFILLAEALGEEYIDYRLVKSSHGRRVARAVKENPKCDGTLKPICENCKDIHMCNDDKSSTYVWTCITGETCSNGDCTKSEVPSCSPQAELPFICSSEGLFPDPADCFKYHICVHTSQSVKFIDYPRTCISDTEDVKYKYNPLTTYCDKIETAKVCASEIAICTKPLQRAATSNPSVYYICKKYVQPGVIEKPNSPSILYPYQYICPNGKQYDTLKYTCVAKGGAGPSEGKGLPK